VKRIFSILFALVLVLSLGLATTAPVLADVINVPGDYPTIQGAIDAASDGDTIVVAAGLYEENVNVNKSLTLQGAQAGVDARTRSGAETIIEPDEGTGIRIFTAADRVVVIDGLTIRNAEHGIATPEPTMAADITVKNVRVLNPSEFGISPTFTLTTTVEYCYVEGAIQAINAGALVPFPATVATFRNNEILSQRITSVSMCLIHRPRLRESPLISTTSPATLGMVCGTREARCWTPLKTGGAMPADPDKWDTVMAMASRQRCFIRRGWAPSSAPSR